MDATVVTALATAVGSLVGATASIAATWLTQRTQAVRAATEWKLRERESLYAEFITEASRLSANALAHSLENPEQLATLYGILSRTRLLASDKVLENAEACCKRIVDLYRRPSLSADELHTAYEADDLDVLRDFSFACRSELLAISSAA
jgi:hypothetical protein